MGHKESFAHSMRFWICVFDHQETERLQRRQIGKSLGVVMLSVPILYITLCHEVLETVCCQWGRVLGVYLHSSDLSEGIVAM